MIITESQYQDAVRHLQEVIQARRTVSPVDAIQVSLPFPSLQSLYAQLLKRRIQSELQHLTEAIRRQIITRVNTGESLYSIALQLKISPYNLANIYLKMMFQEKVTVAKFLSDPMMITNEDIRIDLLQMIQEDLLSSPEIDLMKEFIGKEYEDHLIQCLLTRHMEFETEEDSRRKGRQKTPDILFTIPMAVCVDVLPQVINAMPTSISNNNMHFRGNRSDSFNSQSFEDLSYLTHMMTENTGNELSLPLMASSSSPSHNNNPINSAGQYLIVNWIDSKAMFADRYTFEENLIQFRTYINRYGRGMVIYWQGFSEDILKHPAILMNDDIIIRDSFPDDWIFPTGEPADGRKPMFDEIHIPPPPDQQGENALDVDGVDVHVVEEEDSNRMANQSVSSPYVSPSKEHSRLQAMRTYSL